MEIIPIKYAESMLPESMMFQNGNPQKQYPIVFLIYLIKTDDKNILIDAGCETMPRFEMRNFIGSVKALENAGVATDDITDIVLTHAHHDHIECVKYFPNALIHIQNAEYENEGKTYIPHDFKIHLFEEQFELSEGVKIIRIGGHTEGSCIVEVKKDDQTYVIAGDECYSRKCLTDKIVTGSSCCPQKSKEFIKKYGKEDYKVLLCHEEGEI